MIACQRKLAHWQICAVDSITNEVASLPQSCTHGSRVRENKGRQSQYCAGLYGVSNTAMGCNVYYQYQCTEDGTSPDTGLASSDIQLGHTSMGHKDFLNRLKQMASHWRNCTWSNAMGLSCS